MRLIRSFLCAFLILYSYCIFSQEINVETPILSAYEQIDQFRSTVTIDTTAKILNDIEGINDREFKNAFWYVFDAKSCIYRKATIIESKSFADGYPEFIKPYLTSFLNPVSTLTFEPNFKEVRLNEWNLSHLKLGYVNNQSEWYGPDNHFVKVLANGSLVLESVKPRNTIRTQSELNQIFQKFCTSINSTHM